MNTIGTNAYLKAQYKIIGIATLILSLIIFLSLGYLTALGFLIGVAASSLVGYLGMTTARQGPGIEKALTAAFKREFVTDLLVAGLGLLSVSAFYFLTKNMAGLVGLLFGGSFISAFARMSKDDVGDCARVPADLFETYAITVVSAIILGTLVLRNFRGANNLNMEIAVTYPLILGALSLISSIVGILFLKHGKDKSMMRTLYKSLAISGLMSAILYYPATALLLKGIDTTSIYITAIIGLVAAVLLIIITEYYTSNPVKNAALSLRSTFAPILVIATTILLSNSLAGLYGIAIAGVSMLSLAGIIIAAEVRKGTSAVTKGYAIGAAGLAAVVLFASFTEGLQNMGRIVKFDLSDPKVIAGLLIGGSLPYLFASFFSMEPARKSTLRERLVPQLIPLLAPILMGRFLGPVAVGGMLVGTIVTGLFVGISTTTDGLSINSMIKMINIVALLIVGTII